MSFRDGGFSPNCDIELFKYTASTFTCSCNACKLADKVDDETYHKGEWHKIKVHGNQWFYKPIDLLEHLYLHKLNDHKVPDRILNAVTIAAARGIK